MTFHNLAAGGAPAPEAVLKTARPHRDAASLKFGDANWGNPRCAIRRAIELAHREITPTQGINPECIANSLTLAASKRLASSRTFLQTPAQAFVSIPMNKARSPEGSDPEGRKP